jgi:hypothetical protein
MNKLKITLVLLSLTALVSLVAAQPIGWMPEPVFHQTDFLRLPGVPEFNVDYALVWTDSAAGYFFCRNCSQAGPPDSIMYIS